MKRIEREEILKKIEYLERRVKELESRESVIVVPAVQIKPIEYSHPWEPKVWCEGIAY